MSGLHFTNNDTSRAWFTVISETDTDTFLQGIQSGKQHTYKIGIGNSEPPKLPLAGGILLVFQEDVDLFPLGQREPFDFIHRNAFGSHDQADFVVLLLPFDLCGDQIPWHGSVVDAPEIGLGFDGDSVHLNQDVSSSDASNTIGSGWKITKSA